MQTRLNPSDQIAYFEYEHGEDYFCQTKADKKIARSLALSGIRVGFELEFYLNGKAPDEEIDYFLKVGLPAFADKAAFLPLGVDREKKRDTWYVERDMSLDENDFGFELVSPVMPIEFAKHYFQIACDLISSVGFTTDQCGVHFHISSLEMEEIDMVKLMAFMDETGVLKEWAGRSNYAKDITRVFKNTKLSVFESMHQEMSRYYSVSLVKGNHVELRCMGGAGYDKKQNKAKIIDSLYSFLSVYRIACTPDADNILYKKLLQSKRNQEEADMPEVGIEDVRKLYSHFVKDYGYDNDIAIEMALQFFEEDRLVPRDELEEKLEDEYFPRARR